LSVVLLIVCATSASAAVLNFTSPAAYIFIKGETVPDMGIPGTILEKAKAGAVTISEDAANTKGNLTFATLLDVIRLSSKIKIVKYTRDDDLPTEASFATDADYAEETIGNGDLFIIKVPIGNTEYLYYKIRVTVSSVSIGDSYKGGIVAYILGPHDHGYDPNVPHGLIAAPSDQSNGAAWCHDETQKTGAAANGRQAIGKGKQNTIDIMASFSTPDIAGRICGELSLNGYSDWYLPSTNELNELYRHKVQIGGFAPEFYWSSSECIRTAWYQDFDRGGISADKQNKLYHVRCVRAF